MPRKKEPTPDLVINIEGINLENVINIHYKPEVKKHRNKKDEQFLELTDILHDNDKIGKRALTFFDSKKNKVKFWPVMIDITQKAGLPIYTNKPCRYCHHCFSSHPIGCPIKYNKFSDDKNETIIEYFKKYNLNFDTTDFFETEHIFCSWPCLKAYILNCLSINPNSNKYMNSLSYMTLMFKKIHDIKGVPDKIPTAGPIEIIDTYGGHLTIDEFRSSFGILNYEETVNTRRPYMFSSSAYVEEIKVNV